MGNRAIVKAFGKNIGVYLHWNGGRDSVEAFLEYCKLRGFRDFEDSYGMARFCQIAGNFFGGTLSLGIETNVYMDERCSPGDNGIYEVKGWEIVGRCDAPSREQQEYDLVDALVEIDKSQPFNDQMGESFIKAPIVPVEKLKIGDEIYLPEFVSSGIHDHLTPYMIIGKGKPGKIVNGQQVDNLLYVNAFGKYTAAEDNINNYLRQHKYRVFKKNEQKKED